MGSEMCIRDRQDSVRPLGLRNPLIRTYHREVCKGNLSTVRAFVEPLQVVLSEGGGSILIFTVRGVTEMIQPGTQYEDWIVVKIDLKNAYNETCRAETVRVVESEPSLQHMAAHTATTLAPHSGLECGGQKWGETGEGGTQGDPRATQDFCITLQPSLVLLDAACGEGGGLARGGADDVFAMGPRETVLQAVQDFAVEVQGRCGLEVQLSGRRLNCFPYIQYYQKESQMVFHWLAV